MTKKGKKLFVKLACTECGRVNYFPPRPRDAQKKLKVSKYCKHCRRHTTHEQKS